MAAAAGASGRFLADFYANANRWRRNSNSLRKMYGVNKAESEDVVSARAQLILDDLDNQLKQNEIPESSQSCPECGRTMSLLLIGDVEIDYCTCCKGTWFDPGELMTFTGKDKDVPSDNLCGRRSRFCCPVCRAGMKEFVFQNPHNLLVDSCPFGHGVYLEKDELERALNVSCPVK